MKIMVVDDSPTMRRIAVQMLKQLGYREVVEAGNGQEALTKLQGGEQIDLLLTDWNMPVMTGLELVQAVRADQRWGKMPILMVTTRNMKEDIITAMKAGVNNYLTKPFSPQGVKEKIDKILAKI